MSSEPLTLGDVLSAQPDAKPGLPAINGVQKAGVRLLRIALLAGACTLLVWWQLSRPELDAALVLVPASTLLVVWWLVDRKSRTLSRGRSRKSIQHVLLAHDRQGFMHKLRLDEKTAVFDGNNILHLGLDNGLDAQPLGEIAHRLRSEGYRIVCFFDANIFYTLRDHDAFRDGQRHSTVMLERFFGLSRDEIYVVPSGSQADIYVLECLKYLPVSFAVTNDRYRDYEKHYPTVMKDSLWRKGVVITGDEIRLLQYRFRDAAPAD